MESTGFYHSTGLWITVLVAFALTIGCVLLHYEVFKRLARGIKWIWNTTRVRIVYVVFALMITHIVEIWLFGIGYYLLTALEAGTLTGLSDGLLFEYVYYSAMVYTTVGFGDIVPSGPLMLLTGMEALVGLALITWSASFILLEMRVTWSDKM